MFYFFRLYERFESDHCQGARKVKYSSFCCLTRLLEMPQYYYTGVSDQKLQYNNIEYQKKKKIVIFLLYDRHISHDSFHRRFYNYFAHFMLAAALLQYHLFSLYNSIPLKAQVEQ